MKNLLFLLSGLFLYSSCQNGLDSPPSASSIESQFVFENPPYAECHASTIVELSEGKFMAAWFAGTEEKNPDVTIWYSNYANGQWSAIQEIATGIINDTLRYPCWNPVLFKAREGKLFLFYKVGPTPRDWWGMVKTSTDDGKTWSEPKELPEGFLGPIKNKPYQLADGTILCPSSTEYEGADWKAHIEWTKDLGQTWEKVLIDQQSEFHLIQPSILDHKNGKLQILCRSKEKQVIQAWSEDYGKTWSKATATTLPNPSAGTDAVTLKDGRHVLVYNPTVRTEATNGREKLYVAISEDGINWTDIHKLEEETSGEYSYPAIIQSADGKLHITYTWNRKKVKHVILEIS